MSIVCEETSTELVCPPEADAAHHEHERDDAHLSEAALNRNLLCITGDGTAFSVMQGIGETYLPAFVLALGLGEVAGGLISTVPMLAAALLQMIAPLGVRKFRSHQRWIVFCSYLQAASFLPFVLGALTGKMPLLLVFILASCYWATGLATGPAWNTWMQHLVPSTIRARFFARRTKFTQIGMCVGFVAGGALLQFFGQNGSTTIFAVLFFVAFLGRAISATCLALQTEPSVLRGELPSRPWKQVLANSLSGREGRLLFYLWLVQGAAQISGPYFNPFMLEQLKFSYATYVLILGVSFAAKAITLPLWGRVAHRYGARRLLVIGGVAVVPMSILWLVVHHPIYLLGVQFLAGSAWAAYELAMFLMFFDNIRPEERTGVLTVFNVGHAAATVVGSLIGGAFLWTLGRNVPAYMAIFACSSICRLLTLPWLSRIPARPIDGTDGTSSSSDSSSASCGPPNVRLVTVENQHKTTTPLSKLRSNPVETWSKPTEKQVGERAA